MDLGAGVWYVIEGVGLVWRPEVLPPGMDLPAAPAAGLFGAVPSIVPVMHPPMEARPEVKAAPEVKAPPPKASATAVGLAPQGEKLAGHNSREKRLMARALEKGKTGVAMLAELLQQRHASSSTSLGESNLEAMHRAAASLDKRTTPVEVKRSPVEVKRPPVEAKMAPVEAKMAPRPPKSAPPAATLKVPGKKVTLFPQVLSLIPEEDSAEEEEPAPAGTETGNEGLEDHDGETWVFKEVEYSTVEYAKLLSQQDKEIVRLKEAFLK